MQLRICEIGRGRWNPSLEDVDMRCIYYQSSYERYGSCPPGYKESESIDLCYQQINSESSEERCLTTGGSSLSFLDLHSNEQYSILQELTASKSPESRLTVGLPAKNIPTKRFSSEIEYKTGDVEFQW